MEPPFELTAKNYQILNNYLISAQGDYRVARHLIREGNLEHGTMLAATSIEKMLKVIVGIGGISSKEHLSPKLVGQATKKYPKLLTPIDRDFIRFLEKAYKLRYAPMTAPGFGIVFNQFKTLIALDNLVAHIDRGFSFTIKGEVQETPYRTAVRENDAETVNENCTIDERLTFDLLKRANKVKELHINDQFITFMVVYETDGVSISGDFTKLPEGTFGKQGFTLTKG